MKADILSKTTSATKVVIDPITRARTEEWTTDGNNATGTYEPVRTTSCVVIPFTSSTFRSSQNNVDVQNLVANINEYLEMKVPAKTKIDTNDRVTNIRDASGKKPWVEEEAGNVPTVYTVYSVSPIFDPFSRLQEKVIILRRSGVQGG